MNKLISAISIIVLCGFFTSSISTAEAAQRSGSKHHTKAKTHRHHSKHRSGFSLTTVKHSNGRLGRASWYGPKFHGKRTATGERYNMYAMTAAHKTLPLSSYAEVTNLKNHRTVIVRINDRGPYYGNRVMDLSYAAAKELGIQKVGTGSVEIKPISDNQALSQIHSDQPG